jgi:hypothetical protein
MICRPRVSGLAEIFQKSSGDWAVIDRGPAKGTFSFHWTT